ncbi:MAG: cytochrome c [Chromatiales bacterium]
MRQRVVPVLGALGVCLAFVSGAQAAGDPEAGRFKAATCMGCHGVPSYSNAYPTYHVPKLGGQHPEYIVAALEAYKAGERGHDTMHAQAVSLSEQDMQDIAAYLATYTE